MDNKYHLELTLDLILTLLRMGNGQDGAPKVVKIFLDKAAFGLDNADPANAILFDAAGHCHHFHVRIEDPDGIN